MPKREKTVSEPPTIPRELAFKGCKEQPDQDKPVSYLEYEQEARRQRIKDWYQAKKDDLPEDLRNVPLRELTYEDKREAQDSMQRFWIKYLDGYVHKYNVRLDKDATLEEAVAQI